MTTLIDEEFHATVEILAQAHDEVQRQEQLWGQQNHPLRLDAYSTHLASIKAFSPVYYAEQARQMQRANDVRTTIGEHSWDTILLEEVFEALAETDAERAVTELIQVAAVAINAAKAITRAGVL